MQVNLQSIKYMEVKGNMLGVPALWWKGLRSARSYIPAAFGKSSMEEALKESKLEKEHRQGTWLSGRALARYVQDHEFKPRYHKRNNTKNAIVNCLLRKMQSSLGKQPHPKVTAS